MKIAVAQSRFKTAGFKFNYDSIINKIENTYCDLIIFPQADLLDLGAKDLYLDEKCRIEQANLYQQIADRNFTQNILVGDVLIRNGLVEQSEDGFFDINDKKIFVSEIYRNDVICDLYVLTKNSYFAINSYKEFVDNISVTNNLVYVNAICQADENIYAGGSFAKNRENELVMQMPLCVENVEIVDFNSPIEFIDEPMEKQVIDVTTYALREYCENTGFKKVIFGLSGGIDSALTAVLAVKALGKENVLGIMMPSMYSSEGSVSDSIELAQNLGIKTEKHCITPLFDNFMDTVVHERHGDLAEENLQARLRALILMFFSNRDNYLLLSTGNKSEAAMGYGTLYGDLAGGFNLIADLTKTNIYKIVNYLNKDNEIIPHNIITKAPSAELRPNQKDQDSLPEYEILDDIIEMYVEQNRSHAKIYAKYGRELVDDTIRKIYRAQFKRKQSCLAIRLTERSFFSGVNLPIVQRYY